jgi:hypothetical protein
MVGKSTSKTSYVVVVWISGWGLVWKDKLPRLVQHSTEVFDDLLRLIKWTLGFTVVYHESQD